MLYEILDFLNELTDLCLGHSAVVIGGLSVLALLLLASMFGSNEQVSRAQTPKPKTLTGVIDKFGLH